MVSLVAVWIGAWFASFSAGASAGGGHLNILNPESCLDDEPLWQFLHKRSEFPAVSTPTSHHRDVASSLDSNHTEAHCGIVVGCVGVAVAGVVRGPVVPRLAEGLCVRHDGSTPPRTRAAGADGRRQHRPNRAGAIQTPLTLASQNERMRQVCWLLTSLFPL